MSRGVAYFIVCLLIVSMIAEQSFAQASAVRDDRSMSTGITPVREAAAPDREYVFLPRNTQIEFTGPEAVPFGEVRPNTAVQFVLDRDVLLNGRCMLTAGIPAAGIATRVLHGSRRKHRDGQMDIQVTRMVSGRVVELFLTVINPEDNYAEYPDTGRDFERGSLVKPLVFLGAMLLLILAALHD
jgi:hypothetical protein